MPLSRINNNAIANNTIVAADLAAGSVTGDKIAPSVTLTTPIISGNLSLDSTGTTGVRVPSANTMAFYEGGVESMRITSNGTVAIGTTTTPGAKLWVDSGLVGLTNLYKLGWHSNPVATNFANYITGDDDTNYVALGTNNTERMRIDSSGNVGIGTSSPASLLHITGNDPTVRLTDNGGSPATTWSMRSADGNFAIRDVTNSFDRATFNANGCMALTGANLTATGIGITFPATQSASSNANTLDDYEEGTWTPIITGASTAGTGTYTLQLGRYTKVGRLVTLEVYILWTAHTGTGNMQISNLPFTNADSNNSAVCFGYVSNIALTAGNIMTGYTGAASTNIVLYQYPTGGGATTAVPVDTAGDFVFSVTYSV
jgi:hypothetical protein